jgi:hypothetical protein
VVAQVMAAIRRNHLTSLPDEQLSFSIEQVEPGVTLVDVRENHGGAGGGHPLTAPRLFSFRIDAQQKLSTDARSSSGEFSSID